MKRSFITIGVGIFILCTFFGFELKAASSPATQVPKTCGEYVDIYGTFESLVPDVSNPNYNPDNLPQLQIIKTNGETYFPTNKIQAIWGGSISVTTYLDKAIEAQFKVQTQRLQDKTKKLQDSLPPELQFDIATPSSPTNNHVGEVNWATCVINFSSSTDAIIASFTEFSNIAPHYNKAELNQRLTQGSSWNTINSIEISNKIGDYYYYIDGTFAYQNISSNYFVVSASKDKIAAGVMFYDKTKRSKAEEILKLILGDKGNSKPTIVPPSSLPKATDQAPIIDSINPSTTMSAGVKKSFNNQTGIVTYIDNALILTITGEHLTGASLTTDNIGVDGKPGIEWRVIKVTNDGKTVQAQMIIKPTAQDGGTILTLTNVSGKSTQTKFDVLITGTQYLGRKFSDSNVKFFGDWPQFMPDNQILELETETKEGLNAINKNSYNKLGITVHIYAMDFWLKTAESKYCGPASSRGFSAGGCASGSSRIIYVLDEREGVPSIILHESAHKLHFYYRGSYIPVRIGPTTLEKEWLSALGSLNNCNYLPLGITNWSDGTNLVPHCGFVRSYGAFGIDKGEFYEDIATFTEARVFQMNLLQKVDHNDKRYDQKINILNKYDF